MKIISLGQNRYSIVLPQVEIDLENIRLREPVFIVRLLTISETLNFLKFNSAEDQLSNLMIEEEIFNLVVESIPGLDDIGTSIKDLDIEAGIISTISGTVLSLSIDYIHSFKEKIEAHKEEVKILDQMELLICSNFNVPYSEVEKYSIDKVFTMYSTIARTIPGQELKLEEDE